MGMKNLGRKNLSLTLLTLFIAGMFIITGCSGGGGGAASSLTGGDTGGDTGDTGDTNPYSGDATVSGKIDVDSLSSADQALLSKAVAGKKALSKMSAKETKAYRQRYAASFTEDAVAKLYVVDEDGSLEDTGISGELAADENGDPTYTFDEVADGVNYVVRYLKLVSDGQVLELKANAYVPEGETAPEGGTVDVSPKTTVVVQALVDAILNATSGTGISQSIVNNIITAVKNAIVALVEAGVIQIPSMVVEASGSDIMTIAEGETTNDDLANASGLLLSDESVDSELGAAKTETLAARFSLADVTTDAAKEALIVRVFDELINDDSGDDGIPSFMLEFFTDVYIDNATRTTTQIMNAIGAGLMFPQGQAPDISKTVAITAFKDALTRIYSLLDKKAAGTITEDEKKELAEVPPVLLGLFPITERQTWENLSGSTTLVVPQGLAMTVYIVDVYIAEAFESMQASFSATESGDGTVSYEKEMPFDFDPMVPGSLMDMLGFYEVYQDYAGVDIFHLWIHPGKAWIEDAPGMGGHEVDQLSAGTCLSDVASMVAQFDPMSGAASTDLSGASVTLSYPKSDGTTGSVSLVDESSLFQGGPGPGGMGESCFILDPWREATAGQDPSTMSGPVQLDQDRIISDFASGTYTITAVVNSQTVTKSFTKKVITGMQDAYAAIVTPRSMPPWPGNNVSQTEMDVFNAAMEEYNTAGGESRFSSTVDTDSNGTNDAAKITVTWTAPTVTLPAGVKMGYHLDIGQGGCTPEGGCTWQQIYNTWEHNKLLFTTSFTIPVNLPQDDMNPYQLNVNVIFIDAATGEQLGQGGNTHAQFWVAEPLDRTQTFTITGSAAAGYKVALFKEIENKDSLTNRFTRTVVKVADVVDGAYSLTPTIGDFLDSAGAWFNIVMFQDNDGDGTMGNMDMQIWPDWNSATHVWFNAWGGMLRAGKDTCTAPTDGSMPVCQHSEVVILGGETVEGPAFAAPL